jgi:hypothetical protein
MSEILNVTDDDRYYMAISSSSNKSEEKSKSVKQRVSCSIEEEPQPISCSESIEVEQKFSCSFKEQQSIDAKQNFSCRSNVSEKSEPQPIFVDSSNSGLSDKSRPTVREEQERDSQSKIEASENWQVNTNEDQEPEIKPEESKDIDPDWDKKHHSQINTEETESLTSTANEKQDLDVSNKHKPSQDKYSKSIAKEEQQASSEPEVTENITNTNKGRHLEIRTEMSDEESKTNVINQIDLSSYSERSEYMTAEIVEQHSCSDESLLSSESSDSQVSETDDEYYTSDSEKNQKSNFREANSTGSSEDSKGITTMLEEQVTGSKTMSSHGTAEERLESGQGYSYGTSGSSFLETMSEDFEDTLDFSLLTSCFAQACGIPEKTCSCDPRDREDRLNKPSLLVESTGNRYSFDAYENQKKGIIGHLKELVARSKDDKKLETVAEDDRPPLSPKKGEASPTNANQDCHETTKRSDTLKKKSKALVITTSGDVKRRGYEKRHSRKNKTEKSVSSHDENVPANPFAIPTDESIKTGVDTIRAGTLSRPKVLLSARDRMELAMLERQKRTPESPSFKVRKEVRLTNKESFSLPRNPWPLIDEKAEKTLGLQNKKGGKQKSEGGRRKKPKKEGDKKKKRPPLHRKKHRSSTEKPLKVKE